MTASHEPSDRLTRITDRAGNFIGNDPEFEEGDKVIIFMDDDKFGGIGIFGYDDQNEALADLFLHLRAMLHSMGKDMDVMFLGDDGVSRL